MKCEVRTGQDRRGKLPESSRLTFFFLSLGQKSHSHHSIHPRLCQNYLDRPPLLAPEQNRPGTSLLGPHSIRYISEDKHEWCLWSGIPLPPPKIQSQNGPLAGHHRISSDSIGSNTSTFRLSLCRSLFSRDFATTLLLGLLDRRPTL